MNRNQAVSVIKEILSSADCANPDYIALMPPDKTNTYSDDFQVHLKTTCTKEVLAEIVRRNRLAIKAEDGLTIIYDPAVVQQEFFVHSCSLAKYYQEMQPQQ